MKPKDITDEDILELKKRLGKDIDEYYLQAILLSQVIKRILNRKARVSKSKVEDMDIRPIVEFMKRMRLSSLDKFDTATFISTIHFYETEEKMKEDEPMGTLITYIEANFIVDFLKKLDYPIVDDSDTEDDEFLADASGTICNLIGGNFKSGMTQLGFAELQMSHFKSYKNEVPDGINYNTELSNKYIISFTIGGKRRIVAELLMGKVPIIF